MIKKKAAVLMVILILSATAGVYAFHFSPPRIIKPEQPKVTFALAIQPLPEGRITVLGKGHMEDVLKANPRNTEWERYLQEDKNVLKSVPAPIVLYFTDDNKIGIGSLKGGKLISKTELSLENLPRISKISEKVGITKDITRDSTSKGSLAITGDSSGCPKGYIPISERYCIINTTNPLLFGGNQNVTIISEWVPFMGMEVYTSEKPIYSISPSWGILLDDTAVATYSLDFAGIPLVTFGNEYSGKRLKVSYSPEGSGLTTSDGYIERYINLPVKYIVFKIEILGYDRYAHKRVYIPITGTYPVEIQLTGEYTLTDERDLNRQVLSNTGIPGYLLTDYRIESHFPNDTREKTKTIDVGSEGYYSNVFFDFQGGSSHYFYSAPIGGIAQEWLSKILDVPVSLSITISYSEHATSFITYSLNIMRATSNARYRVKIKDRKVKLPGNGNVELGMYFTEIREIVESQTTLPICFKGSCALGNSTKSG